MSICIINGDIISLIFKPFLKVVFFYTTKKLKELYLMFLLITYKRENIFFSKIISFLLKIFSSAFFAICFLEGSKEFTKCILVMITTEVASIFAFWPGSGIDVAKKESSDP